MGSIHLRALRNGLIAAVVTALAGFALNGLFTSNGSEVADSPTSTPTPACRPKVEPLPRDASKGLSGRFAGLWTDGPNDGWAVGWSGDPEGRASAVLARWDGSMWSAFEDAPRVSTATVLEGVDGSSAEDVWAVGWSSDGFGRDGLIVHFDGTSWHRRTAPSDASLSAVRVLSPDDAWAVGWTGNPEIAYEHAVALHWDGSAWTPAPLPVGGGRSGLGSIAGSAGDLWAVGYHHRGPLLLHFDGQTWERTLDVQARGPLEGVSVAGDTVWLAGSSILRGDGSSFDQVLQAPRGGAFSAVYARSSDRAFVVGSVSRGDTSRSLAAEIDGKDVLAARVPAPGVDALDAIAPASGGARMAGWHSTPNGEAPLVATIRGC